MAGLTRKDLKEVFQETLDPFANAVQADFGRVHERLDKVEVDIKWMKENSGELFKKLDDLISLLKSHEEQMTMMQEQIRRLEDRVAKLEGRHK